MKPRGIAAQGRAAFPTGLTKNMTFLWHALFSPPGHNRAPAVQLHLKSGGGLLRAVSRHNDTGFEMGQGQTSMWFISSSIPHGDVLSRTYLNLFCQRIYLNRLISTEGGL